MGRSGGYKCYNIHCNSCIGKTLCGEPADSALECENRIVTHKTNADRIRSMSDEEIAKWICSIMTAECCDQRCPGRDICNPGSNGLVKWMKQPVKEGADFCG